MRGDNAAEMLCRALLTAIAISYVICVLVLSGMQKEDLDVNLLRKMQRHNINLDDMDTRKLRKDCLTKRSLDNNNNSKENLKTYEPNTTAEPYSTTIDSNTEMHDLKQPLDARYVETVVNYFKTTPNKKLGIFITDTVIDVSPTQSAINQPNNIVELTLENADKISTFTKDPGPQLQSIMKFWEVFLQQNKSKNKFDDTTELPEIETNSVTNVPIEQIGNVNKHVFIDGISTTETTNIFGNITFEEIERMNKILAAHVSRNRAQQTQSPTTRKQKVDLSSISQKIDRFLAENKQNKLNINIDVTTNSMEPSTVDPAINNNNLKKIPSNNSNTLNKNIQTEVDEIIYKFNKPEEKIYTNDPFRTQTKFENIPDLPHTTKDNETEKPKTSHETTNDLKKNTIGSDVNTDANKHLSPETIRQIAETVKEIVLKDLRKEITTSTQRSKIKTTIKTAEATITSHGLDQAKLQRATQAIENFIKLFEQFKPLKENAVKLPVVTKTTKKSEGLHAYRLPIMYHSSLAPMIPYGVVHQPVKLAPLAVDPFLSPQSNVIAAQHISPSQPSQANKIKVFETFPQPSIKFRVDQMQPAPIMMQTNSREIPPLGIPLSEPQLLNRHIVLTTQPPPSNKGERDRWNYMMKYGGNTGKIAEIQSRQERLSAYSNVSPINIEKEFKKPLKIDPRSRQKEKDIFQMNDDVIEQDNKRVNIMHSYGPPSNAHYKDVHDIRGYHERLEGIDDWGHDTYEKKNIDDEYSKMKIAQRQQRPLVGTEYDDTHFRNFLKTQQKVNDMLEKLLATRLESGRPRSVETT